MAKQKIIVPSVGESVTEVGVAKLLVFEGAIVKENDPVIELESDKASVEVPAPTSGKIHFSVKEGDILHIGAQLGDVDPDVKEKMPSQPEKPSRQDETLKSSEPKEAPPQETKGKAQLQEGIRKPMDAYLSTLDIQKPEPSPPSFATKPLAPKIKMTEGMSRKPMSRLRKTIAKRLVDVKNQTAMLTTFNEVDMSHIMAIRAKEKDAFQKKYGVKLTFLPFFVKAATSALKAFPDVNAFIDGDDIVYNEHAHIGIAVSTDTGLVVPVMRNADVLSFEHIAKEITNLAEKARNRKVSMDEMSGGTFTITNGGVFGSMLSTPILNPPQSAILGMHNIVERPVAIDGKVEIRPVMYLALSYDHRIVDGKESVSFLVHMKEILEDPSKLYLYG